MWVGKELRRLLPEQLQAAFTETIGQRVAESLCLFYVAMTRARRCLVMLAPPMQSAKPPKTYAGLLLCALSDNGQAGPAETVWETGDPNWYVTAAQSSPQPKKRSRPAASEVVQEPQPVAAPNRPARTDPQPVRLSPMTDGRRRGLARSAPSRHDQTVLTLP
ncbi:MAG TPA: hypothetical protein DCR20_15440, partial [Planctomycetaceae bacterium]|nr:hypothetical protein [Planctomycetaceae bacterium]